MALSPVVFEGVFEAKALFRSGDKGPAICADQVIDQSKSRGDGSVHDRCGIETSQHSLADPFVVALIADGTANHEGLTIRMFPQSEITGHVVDSFGEPVEQALVQLLRSTGFSGKKKLLPRGYFYTDDRGEYRFGNLPAGNYYLVVGGTPWHSKGGGYAADPARAKSAYVPLYYPNTQNPNAAAPLVLRAGEEGRANFTLTERPGGAIKVKILGELKPGARINLTAIGLDGLNRFQYVGTVYNNEHYIPSVPPGTYDVSVIGENKGQYTAGTAQAEAGESLREITVNVGPPPRVAGTVSCNGQPVPPGAALMVTLFNEATKQSLSRRVGPDGTIEFPAVPAGSVRVMLYGSNDCITARVVRDGKELMDRMLTVGSTDISGLVIEGRGGRGRIKGFVRRNGAKSPGVFVFLSSVNATNDPDDHRTYKTDSDGSYDLAAVRPGDYWLYAVDEDEFEFMDPKVVAPYLKRAVRVSVPPSGKIEKDIELSLK